MSKTMFGNINNLVLSNGTAIVQENSTPVIRNIDNITSDRSEFNHSFIQEGYQFLMEYNAEYYGALKKFYSDVALSEGSEYIIHESFSGIWDTIKKLVRKFIEFIKRCFKKLSEKLHSIFKSEKYLKKHKDLIYKFSEDEEFDYKGYEYTFDADIPATTGIPAMTIDAIGHISGSTGMYDLSTINKTDTETDGDFDGMIGNDGTNAQYATNVTKDKFKELCIKYHEDIVNTRDKYFDKIRAVILGKKDQNITESEYAAEIKKVFRNDEETTTTITVDASYVQECYTRFENYSDALKAAEKSKNSLEKSYTAIERWINNVSNLKDADSFTTPNGSDSVLNAMVVPVTGLVKSLDGGKLSEVTQFSTVMKDVAANIQRISTLHSQAYTGKIEAIKEEFAQNKSILYKAIAKMLKNKKGDKK